MKVDSLSVKLSELSPNRVPGKLYLAIGALLLAFLLAACGGDGTTAPVQVASEDAAQDNGGAATSSAGPTATKPADTLAPSATPAPTNTRSPSKLASLEVGGTVGDRAPEFSDIHAWINSDPLTMEQLRGKVVLIDFWTYTCINCIRTFPFLKLWNSRYSDDGLAIIGVHTPEFEFEKVHDNVVMAMESDGIVWPVAQDNDFGTWRAYSNRFWPAKYLIDRDGVVRYTHFGEGAYAETEEKIRELLLETGVTLLDENLPLPADQMVDAAFLNTRGAQITRELYGGYSRGRSDLLFGAGGYVRQPAYYETRDEVVNFDEPEELEPHIIYFQGPWLVGDESTTHGAVTEGFEDYLAVVYSARSVNAVLTHGTGEPYKVRLTVDGEYLSEDNKGTDVIIGDDGESYLWVDEPKMYNVIENPTYVSDVRLQMSSDSDEFGIFAFTFGVYEKTS